jgi:hypothetical protein
MQSFLIYNSILIFSFLFALLYEQVREKNAKLFFRFCSFLCLWIPAAIRVGIGKDYYSYVDILHQVKIGDPEEGIEPGFILINKFILFFNLDYQWLFVITSFLTLLFVFLSIRKHFSLSILFYVILLLYLYSYNTVRQNLAIVIIMYAITNLMEGRRFKYVVLVLFASTFHLISLIFVPFVFLHKINYKIIIYGSVIICASVIGLVFLSSVDIGSLFMEVPIIGENYAGYFLSDFYGEAKDVSLLGIFARLFYGVVILLFSNRILKTMPQYGIVVIMVMIYICSVMLITRYFLFYRLIQVFLISLVFMLPVLINSIRKNSLFNLSLRYAIFVAIIIIGLVSYERFITAEDSAVFGGRNIVPYNSIFH